MDTNKNIKVIAVDRDPLAYSLAQKLAAEVAVKSERLNIRQTVIPIHGKFSSVMRDIHLCGVPYGSVHGVMRLIGRIKTTHELARVIGSSAPGPADALGRFSHPGTRVFQALRIFVSNELNYALEKIRVPHSYAERRYK